MSVKITDLTEGTTLANEDLLAFVDVSDLTSAASGTTKKVSKENLIKEINGYIVFEALLLQQGGLDPIITVLRNNTGATAFCTRLGVGTYNLEFSGTILTADKTAVFTGSTYGADYGIIDASRNSGNSVIIYTAIASTGVATDDYLNNTFIEIRVYP